MVQAKAVFLYEKHTNYSNKGKSGFQQACINSNTDTTTEAFLHKLPTM